MGEKRDWLKTRRYTPEQLVLARRILEDIRAGIAVSEAIRNHPKPSGGHLGKHALVKVYRQLTRSGEWAFDPAIMRQIRMKPIRSLSGVTVVTVLTKPYPCPGNCIFCPSDGAMPKSYLPDEPGAMRGLHHQFDPYTQTAARLEALHSIGHPTDKIELLVLGGTWSAYEKDYQAWFLKRCLDAMNGFVADSLKEAQTANARAQHRNVGLVVETRPDRISVAEIKRLRALGVTKVQLGAQSLDDHILSLNKRGHTVQQTRQAVSLLRAAGFKVVLHWMPNLLGATEESDRQDFHRLWDDPFLRPDEIKIYPCLLLESAELYQYWQRGEFSPYSTEQLIDLIAAVKPAIPRYCRVNRVARDIPAPNVVAGNKRTSLRQDVHREMASREINCHCIRCREIRRESVEPEELQEECFSYEASGGREHFLTYITGDDKLSGYLRLFIPGENTPHTGISDLEAAAIIREVHVYGQSLNIGAAQAGAAQHIGLGSSLIEKAESIAREHGKQRMAVIAALGTRQYYRDLGYKLGKTYMLKPLAQ